MNHCVRPLLSTLLCVPMAACVGTGSDPVDANGSSPLDQPVGEEQAELASTGCGGFLEDNVPFNGDGVNIHSCPSTSCPVLGLGYRSQRTATVCSGQFIQNGFGHIMDRTTGVCGWSELRYVTVACD
jgi:hypothetical protein